MDTRATGFPIQSESHHQSLESLIRASLMTGLFMLAVAIWIFSVAMGTCIERQQQPYGAIPYTVSWCE